MGKGQVDVDRFQPESLISEKGIVTKWFYDIIFFLRERTGGALDNVNRNIDTIAADKTLKGSEGYLVITAAGVTIKMMADPRIGKPYWFKNASGGDIFLSGNGKGIDGVSTFISRNGDILKFVYDGTEFILFESGNPVDIASPLTAFGDLRVAELSPIFQYSFEYTVDNTELTTSIVANGGTVTQASGMAVCKSSTTTASTSCIQTRREAKYKAGLGGLARFTTLFETGGISATEQFAGLADETGSSQAFKNGYLIGFIGTVFGLHRFQNDSISTVAQADWDDPLDGSGPSGMTLDTSKLNVWAISFQYLGGGEITLLIEDDSTGQYVKVHTILYANANIVPSVFMPNFHMLLFVDNKATTTDLVIKTSSFAYFVEGKADPILTHQPQQSSETQSTGSITTELAILTIRNKATYAGKTNFIELILEDFSCSVEANSANNLAEVRLVLDAALGGVPSYSDINASDSIVEIDTAGTTVTGGKTLFPVDLAGKNDRESINLVPFKILIEPGESVTIAGTSANSATIKSALLWKELF